MPLGPKTAVLREIMRDDRSLGGSRSLNVTDFGIDRKLVYNFLLANNRTTNLSHVSYRFPVIAAHLFKLSFLFVFKFHRSG